MYSDLFVPNICPSSMDVIAVELFGPGVIAEAADDDPSGLARYFVAGGSPYASAIFQIREMNCHTCAV